MLARCLLSTVVLAASFGPAACGTNAAGAGQAGARFPVASLQDWVSYSDHVVVFAVGAEREIPPPPEEVARGEGLVGREVTLRIDGTLWSAPDAPPVPSGVRMTAPGWVLQDGEQRPAAFDDGPRVALGERYAAPLVRVEDDPAAPEWWPLGISAQLRLDGDRIDPDAGRWSDAVGGRGAPRSLGELRAALARQPPDPVAARHRRLRPSERIRAVLRDRGDAAQRRPSERSGGRP